jgi:hypothetical protein
MPNLVTGHIIAEFGDGWEGAILQLITSQHGTELRQRALSIGSITNQANSGFTLEDRIFKMVGVVWGH